MKKFETPELEVQVFEVMDVITTSLINPIVEEDMDIWA